MIKTLIIDDNKIMREYFQTMIDWKSKGFELVSTASNGNNGWQAFLDLKPDLVITDVKMPGMSGLEVANKIKSVSPDTMVVFISSYDEFSYVKGAMDLGVHDYILKHETRGEIFDRKLESIKEAFYNQTAHRKTYYEGHLALALSSYQKTLPNLKHDFPDQYTLLLLELEEALPCFQEVFHCPSTELTDEHITFICERMPSIVTGVQTGKNQYSMLIKKEENPSLLIQQLSFQFYTSFKVRLYVMVLCQQADISICLNHFHQYCHSMTGKYFNKYRSQLELPVKLAKGLADQDDFHMIEILEHADRASMNSLLDQLTYQICNTNDYDLLLYTSSHLLQYILKKHKKAFHNDDTSDYAGDSELWTNAEDIFAWFKDRLQDIFDGLEANPAHGCSKPIQTALDYILENYSNPYLNVGDIAAFTGLDIHHLNRMMKEETNITTIKWLTNIRIEKAKQLLIEGHKLTDIYQAVGYSNISYFSNVFKKSCGETPLEYRRRVLEKEN